MKNLNKHPLSKLVILCMITFLSSFQSKAFIYTLDLALAGQNEVPANTSNATGTLVGTYNDATHVLSFTLKFNGLTAPASAAHFHGPAPAGTNAPVLIGFAGFPTGVTSGTYSNTYTLTPTQESQFLCGSWYVNIHNSVYPGGEIRSQLKEGTTVGNITTLEIPLLGTKEVPANASNATGTFIGTFNNATNVLSFTIRFNGLTAAASAAHIHGPAPAGTNAPVLIGFPGYPNSTSGVYTNSFTLTATQKAQFFAGLLYVNMHNSSFPGGELRGQLKEGSMIGNCGVNVPTLSQWSLFILCLLSLSIGMIFISRKQYTFSMSGYDQQISGTSSFFDKSLFIKYLILTSGLALCGLLGFYFYNQHVSLTDTIGSMLSAGIIAFMLQVLTQTRKIR
jgi:Cu/Zn superoxide dismutase